MLDLENALFPVEERPIFLHLKKPKDESLFDDELSGGRFDKIKKYKAIVNKANDYVFSVVSNDYKLITNDEALELGKQCFKKIFSITDFKDMELYNTIMPKTRSFCHLDFIHRQGEFMPWEGEQWFPFLRITNSYNRTRLLRFDIGFCRWICKNGMIFGSKQITLKYTHTTGKIPTIDKMDTSLHELKKFEKEFIEKLHNLKRYHVPTNYMIPLLCRVLNINFKKEDLEHPKRRKNLFDFKVHARKLTTGYFDEMGQNGYAALNVISDFASRPKLYISPESKMDKLQKRTGDWIGEFIQEIKNDKFNFENYLGKYVEQCNFLQN